MLRIRLVGAPQPPGWNHPDVVFDPAIPLDGCDGLLAWYTPTPELLSYRGPRAWYISEPLTHSMLKTKLCRRARRVLREEEFLHHSNPNPKYRLPAVTHYDDLTIAPEGPRTGNIIATVNNFGNRIWWLRPALRFRTTFITHPRIDLYGNRESWDRFRRWPWSRPAPPPNYCGPTAAPNCWSPDFVEFLSRYRINVCLENAWTPYWFTEKVVNAARAGCVPVYHAHKTVRETFLKGARWIDPADFGFDAERTLIAAQECDAAAVRQQNYEWLRSEPVQATEGYRVWHRIADLFVERIRAFRTDQLR